MRRQRLLRTSSAQSLCIFCASRLAGELQPTLASASFDASRRRINTSQRPRQTAQAIQTSAEPANNNSNQPSWSGFDPTSSLSASEQRERALLQQRREEQQRRVREAEDQRRKREQEAARAFAQKQEEQRRVQDAERRRIEEQWRKEQEAKRTEQRQALDEKGAERRRGASVIRRLNAESRDPPMRSGSSNEHGSAQRQNSRRGKENRFAQRQDTRKQAQRSTENDPLSAQRASEPQIDRRGNPFAATQLTKGPERPVPQRLDMPVFGGGASKTADTLRSSGGGWGSGPVERAPLVFGQGDDRPEVIPQAQHGSVSQGPERGSTSGGAETEQSRDGLLRPEQSLHLPQAQGSWGQQREPAQSDASGQQPSNPTWNITPFKSEPRLDYGQDQKESSGRQHVRFRPSQDFQPREAQMNHAQGFGQQGRPRAEQQGPLQQQKSFGDSGYQATLVDPQEYQQTLAPVDDSHTASWQHLRRRNSEPAPPPAPQMQQQTQRSEQQWDDAAIDRIFQEHQQQRQQSATQQSSCAPYIQQSPHRLNTMRVADRRCARCGELGHVARECNGPFRAKCHLCGETGHFAGSCPQKARNQNGSRAERPRKGQQPAAAGDFFRRTGSAAPAAETNVGDGRGLIKQAQTRDSSDEPPFDYRPERTEGFRNERGQERGPALVRGRRPNAVDDMREQVFNPSLDDAAAAGSEVENEAVEDEEGGDEEPAERVLRSRKFADDVPRREKNVRRSRRDEDDEDDESGVARDERIARKAARKAEKARKGAEKEAEKKAVKARKAEQGTPVNLPEFISVATLAQALGVRYESFVSRLERLGYDDVFPGKVLNAETSGMIAMEYNFEPVFESAADEAEERDLKPRPAVEDKEFLPTRPPVVTIMGHVDHGKTTILDYLRKSSVAAGEAGGITQHIGAFSVPLASSGKTITFLDTPGHAAFLAMRQRGANVTDIVILVVAADDSVKPQTLEAIKHAKAAGVPMIVAVNKVDKEEADVQRVKQDLARHGVEIEDFGGETQVVCVSGKTGQGMDELEEAAVTLSEILDHRAETDGPVEGWVLEATTKKAGRVATVLVRRGTLKSGSVIVAGKTWARVRTLRNEAGVAVREIGPGMPVEVDGWRDQPAAGDEVLQAPSEQKANDVVEYRLEKEEREKTALDMEAINEARKIEQEKKEKERLAARAQRSQGDDYFEAAAQAEDDHADETSQTGRMEVPFIIKADVSGSAEAVSAYILSISSPLIAPRILRSTVGALNESDVELAATAEGHIIAFNLPADEGMKGQAEARGVKVLENNIIYRVLDDVKAVLEDKLPPVVTQKVIGEAEISASFEIGVGGRKKMKIAGCKVRNGVVSRGSRVRVLRGEQKIFDGTIDSLKNVKKDVQEMRKGTECGMGFGEWEAFEVGDQVQAYEETSEKRKL